MLLKARVFKRWFFFPSYWPWAFSMAMAILLLLPAIYLYSMKKQPEFNNETKKFLVKQKIRQVKELKLAAVEPYVWRDLMRCRTATSSCIKAEFTIGKGLPKGLIIEKEKVRFVESWSKPCLLCHSIMPGYKKKSQIVWQLLLPIEEIHPVDNFIFEIYLLVVAAVVMLFVFFRIFNRVIRGKGLIASTIILPVRDREVFEPMLKKVKKQMLYVEMGDSFIRGYMPLSALSRWLKLSVKKEFANCKMCLLLIETSYKQASYEGIRMSQAVALKLPERGILISQELADITQLKFSEKIRGAVLKTKEGPMRFRLIEL